MFKYFLGTIALIVICACGTTSTSENGPVRIDATSDVTAEQSFARMLGQADREEQQQLAVAILKLNMDGVQSAYEVLADRELQSPSIARIKDRVADMTAEEIIELAEHTSDIKVEIQ